MAGPRHVRMERERPGRMARVPRTVASLALLVAALVPATASAAAAQTPAAGPTVVATDTELVAPGVEHTETTWEVEGRPVVGDLLEVDLGDPQVSVDLLHPGAVADRRPVSQLADAARAVAAVNGDFFNINETNAPVGPAVADGRALKAAVPLGQRYGPGAPGLSTEDVVAIGRNRTGRIDRLRLQGSVLTPDGVLTLDGVNQYALKVGGIGVFTRDWGTASRRRATCGTDSDRSAPCSTETTEVVVNRGVVAAVNTTPGSGAIPRGSFVLVGREAGAATLRQQLQPGDPVTVHYQLVPQGRPAVEAAVGGAPILRDGRSITGLDDSALAPRTTAGVSVDGSRLYLLTVDGRSTQSQGLTLEELAGMIRSLGADDAVNLDGGGSSTLVTREAGDDAVTVQNVPSDGAERPVPNALGVFTVRRP
jgi:Phosphodiester glycosidase